MDDAKTPYYSCEEEEDADETLSLSAFSTNSQSNSNPRQSDDEGEADLFEFLIDEDLINNSSGDVMCSADDVIINGKLLPSNLLVQTPASVRRQEETKIRNPAAVSPAKPELGKTAERPGGGSFEKAVVDVLRRKKNTATRPRPKWQLLGVTKFPTEMELRDIKTRQLRQTQKTPATTRGHVIGRRQCGYWNIIGSWKVFNSLSCKKDDAAACSAVVANASFSPTKGRSYVH